MRKRAGAPPPARTAAFLAIILFLTGCGAGGSTAKAPADGIDYAKRGNYKVRAVENSRDLGIGLYDDGSFRLLPEGRLLSIIYDRESGRGWVLDRYSGQAKPTDREGAAAFDNFMPATLLEPYFQLQEYWSGGEFRMATDDGRTFRIRMEGPHGLPSLFEVLDGRGGTIRRVEWSYFRVGEVSRRNFRDPEAD